MPILQVDLGARAYPIAIEPGMLDRLAALVSPLPVGETGLLITDSNVGPLYAEPTLSAFAAAGKTLCLVEIPAGEPSKNMQQMSELLSYAVSQGLDRRSFVVALGGGVVGDLSGYVAASLFRGVPFIQIPTSLLAMVDSAVGGKTGVNLPEGKNLVGAFHQPVAVFADTGVLQTLPREELIAGMAEVIKYGVIFDRHLFDRLDAGMPQALALDSELISHIVQRSCEIKAEVVRQDEREGGLRAILNFGHTLGHAVEKVTGYRKYLHGEAIGIGMAYAAILSEQVADLSAAERDRIIALIGKTGLPIVDPELDWENLRAAMSVDKKSKNRIPRFVLADEIGRVHFGNEIDEARLEAAWKQHLSLA